MTVDSAGPPPPAPAREGVQSVARAARLLACFADADSSLTLTELARRTGLTVSTTHRLLGTLCGEGLLCRDRQAEGFLPGPLLLRLSRSSLLAEDLSEINGQLQALAEETRETTCFAVRRGSEAAVLLAVPSPELLRVELSPGARTDLATSAAGRTLLAFAPGTIDDALDELASAGELTDRSALRIELLATQFRGYGLVDDGLGAGIRALAVPVRVGGAARAIVEVRGPRSRMEDAEALARAASSRASRIAALPITATL